MPTRGSLKDKNKAFRPCTPLVPSPLPKTQAEISDLGLQKMVAGDSPTSRTEKGLGVGWGHQGRKVTWI